MFNKIQQYLLTHHPLLWNIRIVPILCGTILANLFFCCIGYFTTEVDFDSRYSNVFFENGFIYFGAVVSAILFFIFWMIMYSKNNAFKDFYPKTAKSLYLEWILITVIVFSMVSFPYSFYKGISFKTKSYVSKSEVVDAIQVLKMVDILIPDSKTDYFKEYPDKDYHNDTYSDKTLPSINDSIYISPLEKAIQQAEQENKTFENYPNFTQLSLLNYSGYNRLHVPTRYGIEVSDYKTVIDWLKNEDITKVRQLMDKFLALHEKHNLSTNLTTDSWLQLVYNPSKYPVGDFNLINRDNIYSGSDNSYYYSRRNVPNDYYLQYYELTNAYDVLMDAHMDTEAENTSLLVCVCFSLGISLLVFAFRVTSGRTWLIAFVAMGVIFIIDAFFSFIFSLSSSGTVGSVTYILILLLIFIFESVYIINKIANGKSKKRSGVMINHFIGFIPAVPALILTLIYIISDSLCYSNCQDSVYKFIDRHITEFMWGNVCLTFVSMWLFVRFMLLKWKSLPEQ